MKVEHQRKFLVTASEDAISDIGISIKQGYLPSTDNVEVKIRIKAEEGFLTIKGAGEGSEKLRFTYPIPLDEANLLLSSFCAESLVEKIRYQKEHCGKIWDVDVFTGRNEGLILAEIDLNLANEFFERPAWLGKEVTLNPKYSNAMLAKHPYKEW